MDDAVAVGRVQVEPGKRVRVHRGDVRFGMARPQLPGRGLADPADDAPHAFLRLTRQPIAAGRPDDVREPGIAPAHPPSVAPALRRAVQDGFLVPAFVRPLVSEVERIEQHGHPVRFGAAQYAVRVREIRFVRRAQVARGREGDIAAPVGRAVELVLHQVDDEAVDALRLAVGEVGLGLVLGHADDERPRRVALQEDGTGLRVDEIAGRRVRPPAETTRRSVGAGCADTAAAVEITSARDRRRTARDVMNPPAAEYSARLLPLARFPRTFTACEPPRAHCWP